MTTGQKELPAGWKWVKLGDVCRIASGATPKSGMSDYWNGDICWVTPTDLSNLDGRYIHQSARNITQDGFHSCSAELVPEGSVVMSSRAPIGHLGIATRDLCTNQGCKTFIPSNALNTEFLYYALQICMPRMQALGTGATFKEVSKSIVSSFPIPLPPLEEQKRIAGILNKAEEIKKLREEADKKTEELIPAIFHEMVGSRIKKGQELPDGWEWVKLGDVVTVVGGGTPSRANTSYWNGELPWATVTDMNQIRISSTVEKITQLGLKESSSNLIPKGTVIVATRVGLGKVSLPTIDVCINQDLKALIPISAGIINTEYLFSVMQSNGSLIESMGTGATVKGIRLEQLNSLPIPLPPLNQQKRITDRLKDTEEIKKTNADSDKKIEELQSSLLQRAFRGEL